MLEEHNLQGIVVRQNDPLKVFGAVKRDPDELQMNSKIKWKKEATFDKITWWKLKGLPD